MPVITPTGLTTLNSKSIANQWNLTQGDVGKPFPFSQYSDKTVHIFGNFGTGATITMRGSNKQAPDPTVDADWFTLTDAQANPIVKTAAAGEIILENPLWISPSAGAATDGSAVIGVSLSGRD